MNWLRTWRADPVVRALADRRYSRKTPGASLITQWAVAGGRRAIFAAFGKGAE